MATLFRLILALSIAIQSLPALGMAPCAPMAGEGPAAPAERGDPGICPCCQSQRADGSECGKAVVCTCEPPAQDQRQLPLPDREHKPLDQFLAFLPALSAPVLPAPAVSVPSGRSAEALLRRSAPSVQSLLCVWLM